MKRIIAALVLVGSLIYCELGAVRGEVSEDQVNALYSSLNHAWTPTEAGDNIMKVKGEFYKNIPSADQANVLAKLIERSAKIHEDIAALRNIMLLVQLSGPNHTRPWNERLEIALLPQAKSPDVDIRRRLMNIFLKHPEANHREIIIPLIYSFLHEDDDRIRIGVLNMVILSKWPESKEICKNYIQSMQPEGVHKESVMDAKGFTNPEDFQRAMEFCNMAQHTDAQTQSVYQSYIALHKNDPDYEVSVDTAERLSKGK